MSFEKYKYICKNLKRKDVVRIRLLYIIVNHMCVCVYIMSSIIVYSYINVPNSLKKN